MNRNVIGDVYQIGECVQGDGKHEAVRVYVMLNEGNPILIDCGSQLHRTEIMSELDVLLDGMTPKYIFLTHSELPHSGNLRKIVERWPDIQVIVSIVLLKYIEIAPIMPLEQIVAIHPGTKRVFAGRELHFVNALLKDQPGSQWIYDPKTGTMFTGDGFGYYMPSGSDEAFSDEAGSTFDPALFHDYHYDAFRFLRWTVPAKLNAAMDELFDLYDVDVLAPTHGNAFRGQIPTHVEQLKTTLTDISNAYRAKGGR